ncbi:unnamed protein product [Gongylonema pulchrum]|uniref:Secreted protein n=1 Tax=Gongylonema pulchrum TaxID=637853 RepID=A0A183EX88_9BILA|nr:unnamed protein product [Gongylonema pulchrum]
MQAQKCNVAAVTPVTLLNFDVIGCFSPLRKYCALAHVLFRVSDYYPPSANVRERTAAVMMMQRKKRPLQSLFATVCCCLHALLKCDASWGRRFKNGTLR